MSSGPRWMVTANVRTPLFHLFGRRWIVRAWDRHAATDKVQGKVRGELEVLTVRPATDAQCDRMLRLHRWKRAVRDGKPASGL